MLPGSTTLQSHDSLLEALGLLLHCSPADVRAKFVTSFNTSLQISHVLKNGEILIADSQDVARLRPGDRLEVILRAV